MNARDGKKGKKQNNESICLHFCVVLFSLVNKGDLNKHKMELKKKRDKKGRKKKKLLFQKAKIFPFQQSKDGKYI